MISRRELLSQSAGGALVGPGSLDAASAERGWPAPGPTPHELGAELEAVRATLRRLEEELLLQRHRRSCLRDTGAPDACAVAMTPALQGYDDGLHLAVLVAHANTGACTLDVDGLGPRPIRLADGADPAPGDLAAGRIAEFRYDGAGFRLLTATTSPDSAALPDALATEYPSVAALRSARVRQGVSLVHTAGYAVAGDFGGARYRRAAAEPAHAGKVQSADGAWWELAEPAVRPEMFGAAAGSPEADTSAWTAMRDFVDAARAEIVVPPGTYVLTERIAFARAVSIRGAGRTASRLLWPEGAASVGLSITSSELEAGPTVTGLSFLRGGERVGVSGTALRLENTDTAMFDAPLPTAVLEDLEARGEAKDRQSFAIGFHLTEMRAASVRSVAYRGSFDAADPRTMHGTGIRIDGATNPVGVHLIGLKVNRAAIGVDVTEAEGTYLTHSEMVGCNTGVRYRVLLPGTKQPHFQIGPAAHFNCYDYSIDADNLAQSCFTDVLSYRRPDATGPHAHIHCTNCSFINVHGCTFVDGNPGIGTSNGIEFFAVSNSLVGPCNFQSGDTAILIDSDCFSVTIAEQRIDRGHWTRFISNSGRGIELPVAIRTVATTSAQRVPPEGPAVLRWHEAIEGNQADMWRADAAPARFTAPMAGYYILGFEVIWEPAASGRREALWLRNGAVLANAPLSRLAGTDAFAQHQGATSAPVYLEKNDVLELRVSHDAGRALDVLAGSRATVAWVGC